MWASIPTMKLCIHCASKEQKFKALKLSHLKQQYHIKPGDLHRYPIFSTDKGSYILNHAWCSIPKIKRRRLKGVSDYSEGPVEQAFMGCVMLKFHDGIC
jgi:hypothetical protein